MKFSVIVTNGIFSVDRPSHYLGWPARSVAFICPYCLRHWARIVAQGSMQAFHIQATSCENCAPSHWILDPFPGSILGNSTFSCLTDYDLLAALLPELVVREFNLHIKQYDRYIANEPPDTAPSEFGAYTINQLDRIAAAWSK